jgi:energy-coupling factor transport system permease protein
MIRDITLGQYYQTESLLHSLDPRVKIVGTLVYIISLFVVDSFLGYMVCAAFLIAMIKLSNVPVGYIVRGMRAILILLLIFCCCGSNSWGDNGCDCGCGHNHGGNRC